MAAAKGTSIVCTRNKLKDLDFADDMVTLDTTVNGMKRLLMIIKGKTAKVGLHISMQRTMEIGENAINTGE